MNNPEMGLKRQGLEDFSNTNKICSFLVFYFICEDLFVFPEFPHALGGFRRSTRAASRFRSVFRRAKIITTPLRDNPASFHVAFAVYVLSRPTTTPASKRAHRS